MTLQAHRIIYIILVIATLVAAYFALANSSLAELFGDRELLLLRIRDLGALGPLLVIALMILAIVFNPLPSAPVAIASGAIFGQLPGTLYVVIGAEIGAVLAFLIARTIGYGLTGKHLVDSSWLGRCGSQNAMTVIVFVSRLVPFMSFDLMSYAAGLSAIKFWRFALATLLGLLPVSFALAYLGDEIIKSDVDHTLMIILITGAVTLVPLLIYGANRYRSDHHRKD